MDIVNEDSELDIKLIFYNDIVDKITFDYTQIDRINIINADINELYKKNKLISKKLLKEISKTFLDIKLHFGYRSVVILSIRRSLTTAMPAQYRP